MCTVKTDRWLPIVVSPVGLECTTMRHAVDWIVTTIRDRSEFFSAVLTIFTQSGLDTHRTSDFKPWFSIIRRGSEDSGVNRYFTPMTPLQQRVTVMKRRPENRI